MLNICLGERKKLKRKNKDKNKKINGTTWYSWECVLLQLQCMIRDNEKLIEISKYLILYQLLLYFLISDFIFFVIWPAHTSTSFKWPLCFEILLKNIQEMFPKSFPYLFLCWKIVQSDSWFVTYTLFWNSV